MSKSSYAGANVALGTDTFAGWFDLTNQMAYDMSSVVVTVAAVASANSTNGAQTTGNAHVEGIWSANTLTATSGLRGGTLNTPADLAVTSNANFTGANVEVSSNATFANLLTATGNVAIAGGSSNTFIIDAANTTVNTGTFFVKSNASITSATANVHGTTLSVTSNTTISAETFGVTADITTIGANANDSLVVDATASFSENVGVSGILTVADLAVTSNANFTGANVEVSSNATFANLLTATGNVAIAGGSSNTFIIDAANTTVNTGTFFVKSNASITSATANVHGTTLSVTSNTTISAETFGVTADITTIGANANDSLVVDAAASFSESVGISGILTASANALFTGTQAQFNNNVIVGTNSSDTFTVNASVGSTVVPSANVTHSLGSATKLWNGAFVKDVTVAANVDVSGTLGLHSVGGGAAQAIKTISADTNLVGLDIEFQDSDSAAASYFSFAPTYFRSAQANNVIDLGGSTNYWKTGYLTDVAIANSATVTSTLTVNNQANVASMMVRDITATRLVYGGTGGELVGNAGLTFGSNTLTANNLAVSTDVTVAGTSTFTGLMTAEGNATVEGNLTVLGTLSDITVAGTSNFTGVMTAEGDTIVEGNLTVLGTTSLATDTDFTVNNSISTTSTVNSLLSVSGNTDIGNATTDTLTVTARVDSDLVPSTNSTRDFGTSSLKWANVHATTLFGALAWSQVTSKPDPKVTVTLTGDVTGSGNTTLTDLANGTISFATTIAPNSVTLATDTVGNYVATVSAGSGIDASGSGEGATVTISHEDTSSVSNTSVNNSGGTVIQDLVATYDGFGHVLSMSPSSVDLDGRYVRLAFRDVAGDSGTAVADGLTDTLTIAGGSGITTSVSSDTVTVTSTDTLDDVVGRGSSTASNITVGDLGATDGTFGGNVIVTGNLTVNGTHTIVNTATVELNDNIILLNSDEVGTPSQNAGIEIERGTASNKSFIWDEAADKFTVGSETLVAGTFEGTLSGSASTLTTARNISLGGDASGSASFDGSSNVTITVTVADDSHAHTAYANTNGDTFTGQVILTGGVASTYPLSVRNTSGDDSSYLAEFVGESDSLVIKQPNNAGDYEIVNTQQGNGIAFGDGATGLQMQVGGSTIGQWQSGGLTVTGAITVSSTVDGRDLAVDGAKLDGIESGATADQTASEILTAIKTVDGSGSGLDGDLLDGYEYSSFNNNVLIYRNSGSNASGRLKIRLPFDTNSGKMIKFTVSQYSSYELHEYQVSGYLYSTTNQWYAPKVVYTGSGTPDIVMGRDTDGTAYVSIADWSYTGLTVHSVTMGHTGSTPNAYNQGWSAAQDATTPNSVSVSVSPHFTSADNTKLDGIETGATADQTASEILTALLTVDGSGSGLDADLLDGQHSSYFTNASNLSSGTVPVARIPAANTSDVHGDSSTNVLTPDNVADGVAKVALSYGANVAVNMSTGINFELTLTGNCNIDNPSGETLGRSGFIAIIQDGTGSRTASWSSQWKFAGGAAPTLSTGASAKDMFYYTCFDGDEFIVTGPVADWNA